MGGGRKLTVCSSLIGGDPRQAGLAMKARSNRPISATARRSPSRR
jgi:hypothetical protein